MTVLSGCFVGQQVIVVHMQKPYDAYLALSGYGVKSWHVWELFTYQFFHCGWIHWVLNLAGLWFIGRAVEMSQGMKRFVGIYLSAVLLGALPQAAVAVAGFVLPESMETTAAFCRERFGEAVYGASVGLCGLWAVFCLSKPDRRIGLARLKSAHLYWATVGIAALLVVVPTDARFAHVAHLGALLTGLMWTRGTASRPGSGS